jgi:hypothetical protein
MGPDEAIPVKRRRRHGPLWYATWVVVIVSVLLALFVHRGLLGITGLVGAAVVARYMFRAGGPVFTADPSD